MATEEHNIRIVVQNLLELFVAGIVKAKRNIIIWVVLIITYTPLPKTCVFIDVDIVTVIFILVQQVLYPVQLGCGKFITIFGVKVVFNRHYDEVVPCFRLVKSIVGFV